LIYPNPQLILPLRRVVKAQVGRLDHLAVIAGVIKNLKFIEFIDSRISLDAREEISCGEAVAGMIIIGNENSMG
jgi:Domain of unknown function (DUF4277)